MDLATEIRRLRADIAAKQSILDQIADKDERWAIEETRRLREQINGLKREIESLQSGGRRP